MKVEQFIDRLEQQGLLDQATLTELRRKVARSSNRKITPEALAKYLVDRGHLTRFQATKLVGDVSALLDSATDRPAKSKADDKAQSDELRLLPDDVKAPLQETLDLPTTSARVKQKPPRDEVDLLTDIQGDDLLPPNSVGKPAVPPPEAPVAASVPKPAPSPSVRTPEPQRPAVPPPAPRRSPEVVPTARVADDLLADLESAGKVTPSRGKALPPEKHKHPKANEWDSVLLLVGGASLGVLLVLGAFLYLSLTRGAAEDMLGLAEGAYRKESFTEATRLYDEYLEAHPRHERASRARVFREMSRLRQVYRAPEQGLNVAKEALPEIESEASFGDAREQLAGILPQIARGFIEQARLAKHTAAQQELLAKTEDAMKLVDNPNYVTPEHRKTQQSTIDAISDGLGRVRREIEQSERLTATLQAIGAAVGSGDTAAAYRAREELLTRYPGLDADEQLLEAVLKISEKERERVQLVPEPLSATSTESTIVAGPQVLLAHRVGEPIASIQNRVVTAVAGGSIFALDASTGDVLWRRFVGDETTLRPQSLFPNQPDSDLLAVDQRQQQIMRLEARTGKLRWCLNIGEPFAKPVVVDEQVYVSARSGKIHRVNVATGNSERHVLIPHPLEVPVGVGVGRPQLYQVADQDNLYVMSLESQECLETYYIGHRPGTIQVPPVMALGYLFVAENAGPDYSFLHILGTDERGLHLKPVQAKFRLNGRVLVPPIVSKDKVLVVTDRREIDLYEATLNGESSDPVSFIVQQTATSEDPMISYALMDSGYMWVANNRLAKYQVQNSAGKIPVEWVLDDGDLYLAPMELVGDVIVHTRRRQNSPGVTVAAVRANEQIPVWQTEFAVPARSIVVQGDRVDAVNARGRCFGLAPLDAARSIEVTARASAATDERIVLSLTDGTDEGNGEWVFGVLPNLNQVVYYRSENRDNPLRLGTLAIPIGNAATSPVPFAGGLLVPLKDGTIVCLDPQSGGPRFQPFQPSNPAAPAVQWNPPGVVEGGKEFVIADTRGMVYRVGTQNRTQLVELVSRSLECEAVGPAACAGTASFVTKRGADCDTLIGLNSATLAPVQQWPMQGRLQWGPVAVGDSVWAATESELISVEGVSQIRWRVEWKHAAPIGRPLVSGGHVCLATKTGWLIQVDPSKGAMVSTIDVGELLSAGPVLYGNRLLVAGQSGTVLMVAPPGA